ncbi:DUF4190 domain-containing protein [Tsukamurella sp. NPDC003166]|uniref:DUF4190 domain-containing protein n=1 Tax=Tsukamurella sp. NPDC003166 TaxID=3154444 RepID=UPI0033B26698
MTDSTKKSPDDPGIEPQPGVHTGATNGFAIAALVSSLVLAPLGIIFGHISLRQIRRTGEGGRGLAIAGLVVGYLGTIAALVSATALIIMISEFNTHESDAYGSSGTTTSTIARSAPTQPVQIVIGNDHYETHDAINAKIGKCLSFEYDSSGILKRASIFECGTGYSWPSYVILDRWESTNTSLCSGPDYITDGTTLVCLAYYQGP